MLSHNIGRQATGGIAGTPHNTRTRASHGEGAVEPQHARRVISPEGHDQYHAAAESITHLGEAALPGEVVVVAEHGFLLGAELAVDAVGLVDACNVGVGVGDDFAILPVDTADFSEGSGVGVAGGDELGRDGDLGVGVNSFAGAVEGGVAQAVRVGVAAIFVTDSAVLYAPPNQFYEVNKESHGIACLRGSRCLNRTWSESCRL